MKAVRETLANRASSCSNLRTKTCRRLFVFGLRKLLRSATVVRLKLFQLSPADRAARREYKYRKVVLTATSLKNRRRWHDLKELMRRHGNRDCLTRALPKAAYQQKGGAFTLFVSTNCLHQDLTTGTDEGHRVGNHTNHWSCSVSLEKPRYSMTHF